MSPLDNELRRTLTQHASDVDATSDLWVQVEHRARVLHRRRVALAGVSGAGVVAAVVVVGLTVAGGSQADRVVVPLNPGPSDSATASPSPAVSPTLEGGRVPVTEWPRVGASATWVQWNAVLQSMPAQMPSDFAPLGEPAIIGSG